MEYHALTNVHFHGQQDCLDFYMFANNGNDFQMRWPEVKSLIQKNFRGWTGTWNVWATMRNQSIMGNYISKMHTDLIQYTDLESHCYAENSWLSYLDR